MNWPQILDQAGNIAIGLVLLFVGVPIVVLTLTFLGKLLVNIISWPLGLIIFVLLKVYRWLLFKLFGKQVLQSIFSQDKVQAQPSVLTRFDAAVLDNSAQDAKPKILDLDFRDDENTPFGFTVVPKDTSTYKKTEVCMHLDSPYARMSIFVQGSCINYLFDKNRKLISWEQRAKELENFPAEEKLFGVGYKVIRTRCVIPTSESNVGTEYCADILYYRDTKIATSQSDLVPIQTIYEKHLADVKNSSLQKKSLHAQKRIKNKKRYLDPKTPYADRMAILFEELGCEVATLGYHFMARDTEALFNLRNYAEYCYSYFSKIENSEENYINYLRAYCYGLREAALDDIEGDEELELIEQLCKDANLLHVFEEHKSTNPLAGELAAKATEYAPKVETALAQIQKNKTTKDAKFDRDLVGRRLLQVCGSRTAGTKYRFSDEADIFWLAVEGDTPQQIIWLSPQWKYRGANIGFELDVEVKQLPVGQMPTAANGMVSSSYSQPTWQALTGLYLYNIHSRNGYEQQSVDPLTLYFARQFESSVNVTNMPMAKLSFDSPDLDEPYVMGVSGDKELRHWALRSDIQLSLADILCADGIIKTRRNIPPAPWCDKEHLMALNVFYVSLQTFAIWWQTQTDWPITTKKRQGPAPGMWLAVQALASFQIALHEGNRMQSNHGGWLDHDGEEYGESWVRLTHAFEYEELAQSVREHAVNWMRYMAWDEWQSLLADGPLELEDFTRTKWRQVCSNYISWYQYFLDNK